MTGEPLPQHGERCTDVLSNVLRGYAGIEDARFEPASARLSLTYDRRLLSEERAMRLVRHAGQVAGGRVAHCVQRGHLGCAACSKELAGELLQHYRQLAEAPILNTQYQHGVMEITVQPPLPGPDLVVTEGRPALAAPEAPRQRPAWFSRQRLEILFTVLTLVAAVLAALGSRLGLAEWSVTTLFAVAFAAGGFYGLLDGVTALTERRLDVNLLMIFAALGAAAIGQPTEGAALLFLFSLSNTLQSFAMERSRRAIEKLLTLRPARAVVRRGSRLVRVPVEQLLLGDVVLVRPGERFPIDGAVIDGESEADQATITGESVPVAKGPGDDVFAGTMNGTGALEVRVTRLAQDTTLARIVSMVEEAQSRKAHSERALDRFEQLYALFVLGGAALLIAVPTLALGQPFQPTFYRAMTWLVVASPCALVISTPASILSAIANGARHGILFKGGVHLERAAQIKVVAFDKTGTLTHGAPSLAGLYPLDGVSEADLLTWVAALEARSEHPLGRAVVRAAAERGLPLPEATDFRAVPGQGVEGRVQGAILWVGGERLYAERGVPLPPGLREQMRALEEAGQTVMAARLGERWLGLIGLADTIRPDAAAMVQELKSLGIQRVVMLTGDNERVAARIAAAAGVDEFHAGLLPQDKVTIVKALRKHTGPTAMIGDGVNDAPALAAADVGVAMGGAGADVAMETADLVLMADNIAKLPHAIGLAHQARRTIYQNLGFALAVIVLLVTSAFGAYLPLPLGVVGHEGSTVLVVLNGLRLLGYRR